MTYLSSEGQGRHARLMIAAGVVLLFLPSMPAATAEPDQPVAALVERVAAAYGGRAVLDRARRLRQAGRTISSMAGAGDGRMRRVFEYPDRLAVEIAGPGAAIERRVLNGALGWRNGVEAAGPMHGAMALQAARLALPLLLLDRAAEVVDLGTAYDVTPAGVRTLGLALGDGLALFIEIDQDSARIQRTRGLLRRGGMAMEFSTDYGDFRVQDGLLVAAREEQRAMGQPAGVTLIDEVDLLDAVASDAFRP